MAVNSKLRDAIEASRNKLDEGVNNAYNNPGYNRPEEDENQEPQGPGRIVGGGVKKPKPQQTVGVQQPAPESQWDNIIDNTPEPQPQTPEPKGGPMKDPGIPHYVTAEDLEPNWFPPDTPTSTPEVPTTPQQETPQEQEQNYTQPPSNFMPYGDQRSRNDNDSTVPVASDSQNDTGLFQDGLNNVIDNETPDNTEWTPNTDNNGSALGGTNYPGNGYVPTNLLRSEDFNRVTPYDPYNTVYSSTGQLREVGQNSNGIYDRPVGISPNDFYYQGGLEAGLSPQEAIQYSLEEHAKEGTTPVFETVGEMMDYYADEARDNYRDASENIPANPNRYDPYSAIDRYREGGGPRRDAEFKAGYRDVVNQFEHADQVNDAMQDYIDAKLALDGKTRGDYTNSEWNAIEQEAAKYAEGAVPPNEKADVDYLEKQANDRWNQDEQRQADVAEQVRNLEIHQPSSGWTSEQVRNAEEARKRQNNTPTTGGSSSPATNVTVNQDVVDLINNGGYVPETTAEKRQRLDEASRNLNSGKPSTPGTTSGGSTGGNRLENLIDYRRPGMDMLDEIIERPASGTTGNTNTGATGGTNKPNTSGTVGKSATRGKVYDNSQNLPGLGTPGGKTAPGAMDTRNYVGNSGGSTSGVPEGSQYFRPSYGQQEGPVVKAPYKTGGYTEAELQAMGNKPYATPYGQKGYEGYYQAPDKRWYPVDMSRVNQRNYYGGNYSYSGGGSGGGSNRMPYIKRTSDGRTYFSGNEYMNGTGGSGGSSKSGGSSGRIYSNGSAYYPSGNNTNTYVQPDLVDQTRYRISNFMKNWAAS